MLLRDLPIAKGLALHLSVAGQHSTNGNPTIHNWCDEVAVCCAQLSSGGRYLRLKM